VRLAIALRAAAAVLGVAATLLQCGAALAGGPPALGVRSAVLVEAGTGQWLDSVQANARVPIASTTKLMTALITLEHVKLGAVFAQEPGYYPAAVDSQIGLVPGERMSVHDLMLAMLLPSADDAAEDLAYNVGHGSAGRFVAMMNARARELGLSHTHYSTPVGLDTPGNFSSAADLVKLAAFLLAHHASFARMVALKTAVLHTGRYTRFVVNRNDLVARYPWINGVKTGHTYGAGYVLVASATRYGMSLLSAVLGTASQGDRDANAVALLDYGFANFRVARPVLKGNVLARPTVRDRPGVRADVIAGVSVTHVVPRSARISVQVHVPHELAGPLKRHAVVGYAVVLAAGHRLARIPLLLAEALPAVSPLTLAARFFLRPSTLVLLAALVAVGIGLIVVRRERTRGRDLGSPEAA
jgi:D-alanyl-D-alanine carboxypeptidase (penicillin-binding protein 5/6)